jgi:hypothetical protein
MPTTLRVKNEIIISAALLFVTAVFSLINFSSLPIKPNIFLAAIVVASLVIEIWYVYFGLILAELLWLKFTPFFIPEYGILFVIAAVAFAISHLFIFGKTRSVRIALLVIFQLVFWLFLQAGPMIISLVFLLELVYNTIAVELLFALSSWLKKISF